MAIELTPRYGKRSHVWRFKRDSCMTTLEFVRAWQSRELTSFEAVADSLGIMNADDRTILLWWADFLQSRGVPLTRTDRPAFKPL